MCPTAGSAVRGEAAAGKPRQCSARLHQAFHQHSETNLGHNVLCGTDGIFRNIFLGSICRRHAQSNAEQLLSSWDSIGLLIRGDSASAVTQAQAVTTLACVYPAEASEAAIHTACFPFMPPCRHIEGHPALNKADR